MREGNDERQEHKIGMRECMRERAAGDPNP